MGEKRSAGLDTARWWGLGRQDVTISTRILGGPCSHASVAAARRGEDKLLFCAFGSISGFFFFFF